jgi:hypothetical protein
MSSSSSNPSSRGQAEASSSRALNGKQPVVEDDHSDEEALLADDPLEHDLPEQYENTAHYIPFSHLHVSPGYPSSANPRRPHPPSASRDTSPHPSHHLATALRLSHDRIAQMAQQNSYSTISIHLATQANISKTPKMPMG